MPSNNKYQSPVVSSQSVGVHSDQGECRPIGQAQALPLPQFIEKIPLVIDWSNQMDHGLDSADQPTLPLIKRTSFWFIILLTSLTLLIAGCQTANYEYKGTFLDPPISLPDFELATTEGSPFHLSDVEGDVTLLFFGYTYCPDVCPLTLADVRQALAGLESGRERVHVIFISVDPERDTPEVLERYLSAFDPSFIGLTDDPAKIETVMKDYGAFAEKEEPEQEHTNDYLVSHTARLYLISPNRELTLLYSFGFEPDDLQRDLNHLLQQEDL